MNTRHTLFPPKKNFVSDDALLVLAYIKGMSI